ncbi:MAG: Histidine triad (HIT) protein [Clostridia bacterium 62_21]|nr:MAG: Histidine triad (HIT) protein [Clostridia bacterium 62_21]
MEDCIFCKIVRKEIPADIVYEDEQILVFKDINPQAPVHLLLIPKKHISTLFDADAGDEAVLGAIQVAASRVARDLGLHERGFRLVTNCQKGAGQLVFHVHYHLLAGRAFAWPPG